MHDSILSGWRWAGRLNKIGQAFWIDLLRWQLRHAPLLCSLDAAKVEKGALKAKKLATTLSGTGKTAIVSLTGKGVEAQHPGMLASAS